MTSLIRTFVIYFNDALIIANSIDQALERLNTALDTLVKAGFSFNFAKRSFKDIGALFEICDS